MGEADRKLLKMAIKSANSGSQVKNRVIPQDTILKYRTKVEQLSPQVAEILEEEKAERAIRETEMQIRRSQNMIRHEKEIFNRPARTWFKTNKEKKDSKRK